MIDNDITTSVEVAKMYQKWHSQAMQLSNEGARYKCCDKVKKLIKDEENIIKSLSDKRTVFDKKICFSSKNYEEYLYEDIAAKLSNNVNDIAAFIAKHIDYLAN